MTVKRRTMRSSENATILGRLNSRSRDEVRPRCAIRLPPASARAEQTPKQGRKIADDWRDRGAAACGPAGSRTASRRSASPQKKAASARAPQGTRPPVGRRQGRGSRRRALLRLNARGGQGAGARSGAHQRQTDRLEQAWIRRDSGGGADHSGVMDGNRDIRPAGQGGGWIAPGSAAGGRSAIHGGIDEQSLLREPTPYFRVVPVPAHRMMVKSNARRTYKLSP